MDQGYPRDCCHLMDGGDALFASIVRLSLRSRNGLKAIGDVQANGAPFAEGDHQSRDGCDLVGRTVFGLGRPLVFSALVALEVFACADSVRRSWNICPTGERFCS